MPPEGLKRSKGASIFSRSLREGFPPSGKGWRESFAFAAWPFSMEGVASVPHLVLSAFLVRWASSLLRHLLRWTINPILD
jgi:hypothetical protein